MWPFTTKKLLKSGLDPRETVMKRWNKEKKGVKETTEAFTEFVKMAEGVEKFSEALLSKEKVKMDLIRDELKGNDKDDGIDINGILEFMKVVKQERIENPHNPIPATSTQGEVTIEHQDQMQKWISWAKLNPEAAHDKLDELILNEERQV